MKKGKPNSFIIVLKQSTLPLNFRLTFNFKRDVHYRVFSCFLPKDLYKFQRVNKFWYGSINSVTFFKHIFWRWNRETIEKLCLHWLREYIPPLFEDSETQSKLSYIYDDVESFKEVLKEKEKRRIFSPQLFLTFCPFFFTQERKNNESPPPPPSSSSSSSSSSTNSFSINSDIRTTFKVTQKRKHVERLLRLKKSDKHAVKNYSMKTNIPVPNLNRWLNNKALRPGFNNENGEVVVTEKRTGKKIGRKLKYGEKFEKILKEYLEKEAEAENLVDYADIKNLFIQKEGESLKKYEICRLLMRVDAGHKVKTSKSKKDLSIEEIEKWESVIADVNKDAAVLIWNLDEKPMPIVVVGSKTFVLRTQKQVAFDDGGRNGRKIVTLSVGTWIYMSFGEIKASGRCGIRVLMRGKDRKVKIPSHWKNRRKHFQFEAALLKDMNEMDVISSGKGVVRSDLWLDFLKFHEKQLSDSVKMKLKIDDQQYNNLRKVLIYDSAPGHHDKKDSEDITKFLVKWKEEKKIEQYFTIKNASDRCQPNDLGVNRELKKEYCVKSKAYLRKKIKTKGGSPKLPGNKIRIGWYAGVFAKVKDDTVKLAWERAGFGKSREGKFLWR